MFRRALGIGAASFVTTLGCSFVVSTTGLSGGRDDTPDADRDATSADVVAPDTSADVATEKPVEDPSLVGMWSFEDADGRTATDSSGKGNHGALFGDVLFQDGGARGRAARFSDTGRIEVPTLAGARFPQSGTLSLWLDHDFAQDDPLDRDVLDGWDNQRQHLFLRRVGDGQAGDFQVGFQPANNQYAFGTTFVVPRAKWIHVVIVWVAGAFEVGEGRVFVDRVEVAHDRYSRDFSPTAQSFVLGRSFIGAIDEVKLFSRPFSAAEAVALE